MMKAVLREDAGVRSQRLLSDIFVLEFRNGLIIAL